MLKNILLVVLILVIAFFVYQEWSLFQPQSSGSFEMTGEFQTIYGSGSLRAGGGEEFNTTLFTLIVSKEEMDWVEKEYPIFLRKSWGSVENRPDYMYYGRESTGNWCGDIPSVGNIVHIKSPTGFTKDLTIEDLTTGKIYRTEGECGTMLIYYYRVADKKGNILKAGIVYGHDLFEAKGGLFCI